MVSSGCSLLTNLLNGESAIQFFSDNIVKTPFKLVPDGMVIISEEWIATAWCRYPSTCCLI
ncbi:hypothetical protein VAE151_530043 [Vibrio aestuarianus]|nr:hypothetical protein VAE128_440516 [Vibrio aestuarianus]CAH8189670.1 hypothetical protein VAE130_550520 [Vibrio aestuarianus]CAH8197303.1 hypothetical protein VAE142_870514 [Vibrio aestuarianus]CAH8199668.1 hypothetical protein VAE016_350516 [Vibrio aestuarianus]CAH8201396.1 hypothetical protein VAE151_530043 [Vibrio aestuarianus]